VAHAIFQRYPNPFARHVLSEDTVHRELIDGRTLYSRRFLTKTNKVPSWGEKWLSGLVRRVPMLEESYVDTQTQTITLYTRSVGLATFMTAIEKVSLVNYQLLTVVAGGVPRLPEQPGPHGGGEAGLGRVQPLRTPDCNQEIWH
jgi:hypothetical protein